MSNLLRRTSKLRKKKRSKSMSEDEESVELTSSTSHKIMNEIKSHFIKDKSEFRKSKKKNKQTPDEHQSKSDLKYEESIVEAVNPLLPNFGAFYTPDSRTFSELSSNTSDISYGILEDSRDTSTCSSRESLRAEINTDDTGLDADNIIPKKAPLPHPILQKTQSLSRKNSTVNFIRSIFKRSSSEITRSSRILDTEIAKSSKIHHKVNHTKSVTLNDRQAQTEVKMRRQSFSIKRRLSNLMSETPGSLNRSSSIRDFALKGKSDNVELWRASLKSLVETDQGVSYNDLSFVNYDVLNTYSYKHYDDENARLNVQLARFYSASTHNVFHEKPKNRYSVPSETLDRYCQSTFDLSYASEAASLPTLHHLEGGDNVPSPGTTHRYRRRLESSPGEDTQPTASVRNGTASSFRSSGSGCSKLRRHNACRQVKRDVTPLPDRNCCLAREQIHNNQTSKTEECVEVFERSRRCKLLSNLKVLSLLNQLKIVRESLNIDPQPASSTDNQQYEWRRLVGSIRRRVQRHGTSASEIPETDEPPTNHHPPLPSAPSAIRRKSSLTHHSKLDFFRREKSRDEPSPDSPSSKRTNEKGKDLLPLAKQRSVGFDISSDAVTSHKLKTDPCDIVTANKIVDTKIDKDKLFVKSSDSCFKGVRKSDNTKQKDYVKVQKPSNFSFRTNLSSKSGKPGICGRLKEEKNMNREDFLKATMRIFLVVSPPVGKMQVRSRSLNHLDTLEQTLNRQQSNELTSEAGGTDGGGGGGAALTTDHTASIKDYSRSEPDCTMTRPHQERLLTVPPTDTMPPGTVDRNGSDRARTTTRRQMLSRSQVSSSEYFSVSFELNEDSSVVHGREEFLPATKGTSLGDALAKVCERRSIDLSICDIYIDGCRYASAHVLNQETSALGGKTIRITGKETSNKKSAVGSNQGNHYRKPSGSYRGKTSSLFFSTSTEDTTCNVLSTSTENRIDFDQNKKQSKQRWSGFFGNNKDTRMESLVDQLNHYSRHGVPNSDKHLLGVDEEVLEALYSLEEDWRQLVDPCNLSERLQQQQTAIWELITTEVAYIKTLRVVTGLFLACLKSLQSCNILTEIDTEKLFSNITEILECNLTFWNSYVYPVVVRMRTNHETISPIQFLDGFVRMRETYHSYFRYCAEQARCQHYCRENHAHNEVFTAYLAWCETQKECNRLRLMDILVRPMQRLTKYGLLLKAIIKNTDDDYEKESLNTMIRCVDDFVNSVNSSLRQKQDNERLRGIMLRIESYDAVETKDDDIQAMVQKFNHLDLSQPMPGCPPDRKRHLLLEGDLKLKDSSTSKMEVHCFLLTDILLICKPSSKKGGALMRVIRQPYLVDRLILQELNRETPSLALVYLNEFKTANAAFILQNNDQKKLKSWADSIRKAQGLYEQAKQTPTFGLMRQLSASVPGDEYLEPEYSFEYSIDGDSHSLQSLIPRSPLASSSRASRVSSLAHSHSGSVEMNDQSSLGSTNNQSRGISIENENRTASISSDEGVLPLPTDSKSPINQKNSLKQRLFNASPKSHTPNTLSVQPYGNLGQSLPNLTLGSPNVGTLSLSPNQNTLLVPTTKTGQHLLSPNTRGISYPPPSPTRGNLRRGFAITQSKNPPLLKIGHVNSTAGAICTTITKKEEPTNFDVPVIAGISPPDDLSESFNRGQHRQAMMKRIYRSDNRRYHTAGVVDDIKKNDEKDTSILKRLSWNCGPSDQSTQPEDHTT